MNSWEVKCPRSWHSTRQRIMVVALWVADAFFLSLLEVERYAVAFFLSSPEIQACARLNAPGPCKDGAGVCDTFSFLENFATCLRWRVAASRKAGSGQAAQPPRHAACLPTSGLVRVLPPLQPCPGMRLCVLRIRGVSASRRVTPRVIRHGAARRREAGRAPTVPAVPCRGAGRPPP